MSAGQSAADEDPVGRLAFGVGYDRDSGVSLVGAFQHRALMGRDQSIDLAFSVSSQEQTVALDYRLNRLGDGNPTFGVAVSHAERDRSERQGIDTSVTRVSPGAVWDLGDAGVMSLGLVFIKDDLRALAEAPAILQDEDGARSLMGVALNGELGFGAVELGFNAVLLDDGEDLRYTKAEVALDYALPIPPGALSAELALRAGAINVAQGQTTLNDRFLPSSGAIRGFEANGFGPVDPAALDGAPVGATRYAVMSFDTRYAGLLPGAPDVSFGLFMDVGSAWGLDANGDAARATIDADTYWRGAAGITIGRDFGAARLELVLSDAFAHRPSDRVQNVQLNFSSTF
ncbi:MAG: OmpIP family porin [Roseibaca calidilacus]|uniref:OmpIP family porin n=1 Tax=Roseibaca calidilacus TaxID=1666912 RepID=A0A0P7Z0F9_9RHOB|nr:MAG: OmpIP family porin [Roseibaca calidilacus]